MKETAIIDGGGTYSMLDWVFNEINSYCIDRKKTHKALDPQKGFEGSPNSLLREANEEFGINGNIDNKKIFIRNRIEEIANSLYNILK
jgi:hypothetical protein